jgi:hypothetical protein
MRIEKTNSLKHSLKPGRVRSQNEDNRENQNCKKRTI